MGTDPLSPALTPSYVYTSALPSPVTCRAPRSGPPGPLPAGRGLHSHPRVYQSVYEQSLHPVHNYRLGACPPSRCDTPTKIKYDPVASQRYISKSRDVSPTLGSISCKILHYRARILVQVTIYRIGFGLVEIAIYFTNTYFLSDLLQFCYMMYI